MFSRMTSEEYREQTRRLASNTKPVSWSMSLLDWQKAPPFPSSLLSDTQGIFSLNPLFSALQIILFTHTQRLPGRFIMLLIMPYGAVWIPRKSMPHSTNSVGWKHKFAYPKKAKTLIRFIQQYEAEHSRSLQTANRSWVLAAWQAF